MKAPANFGTSLLFLVRPRNNNFKGRKRSDNRAWRIKLKMCVNIVDELNRKDKVIQRWGKCAKHEKMFFSQAFWIFA